MIEYIVLATLRASALLCGITLLYFTVMYEQEEQRVRDALSVWWVNFDDHEKGFVTFLQAVALTVSAILGRILGFIVSPVEFFVTVFLMTVASSVASSGISLIADALGYWFVWDDFFLGLTVSAVAVFLFYKALRVYRGKTPAIYTALVLMGLVASTAMMNETFFGGAVGICASVFFDVGAFYLVYVSIVSRDTGAITFKRYIFVATILLLIGLGLPALIIAGVFFGTLNGIVSESWFEIGFVGAISFVIGNIASLLAACSLLVFSLVLLGHKYIFAPATNRFLYFLQRHPFIDNKKLLFGSSVVLIAIALGIPLDLVSRFT